MIVVTYTTKKIVKCRQAFTLIEMLVVIAIILVLAALAAAFMPRVQDSTKLTNGIDQLEQWLLTAKMRAKRDGVASGIRLIQDANSANVGMYTSCQYIQQPDPISGGSLSATGTLPAPSSTNQAQPSSNVFLTGSICLQTSNATNYAPMFLNPPSPPLPPLARGQVQIYNFDPTLGGLPSPSEWLVQTGDYLKVNDSGLYVIAEVLPPVRYTVAPYPPGIPVTTLILGSLVSTSYFTTQWPQLPQPARVYRSQYELSLSIPVPTTNFRIYRQPRPILGENPLQMSGNIAVDGSLSLVQPNVTGTNYDILFSPSGAVVGTNAGHGKIFLYVHDLTQNPVDTDRSGVVAIQTLTGFIGAYNAGPLSDPYLYANEGRISGM